MMATEMQNRLFRLGLSALAQVDGQLQRMYAAVATSETTLVAFSVSGYARSVIDAVQVAQQYGATTIAITAPDSALAKAADTVIHFQPLEDGKHLQADIVALRIAGNRRHDRHLGGGSAGPKVLENLRRIKQSVNTLKVDDPRLPLGD